MSDVLNFLGSNGEGVLAALALVLGAAAILVRFTPSDKDDKVVSALKGVVDFLASLVGRKPAPPAPPQPPLDSDNMDLHDHDEVLHARERLDRK